MPALPHDLPRYAPAPSPRLFDGAVARWSARCDGEPPRSQEFSAGRMCARQALGALHPSLASVEVGIGPAREPLWPPGIVGSITHKHGFVSAAVARATDLRALGIDTESVLGPATSSRLPALIATPDEIDRARALAPSPAVALTLLFAAKESVYKALHPLVRRVFDFLDVEVRIEAPGAFLAIARVPLAPALLAGQAAAGSFILDGPLVHTGVAIRAR